MRRLSETGLVVALVAGCAAACSSASSSGQAQSTDGGGTGGGGGSGGGGGVGGGDGGSGGGDAGEAGSAYPAPHAPMPHVVSYNGPVMAAPRVVAITFQGDSLQASVDAFVGQLVAATSYWSGATSEYGVGPLSASAPVHSTDTPAATLADSDVRTWLTQQIQGGGGFPQPDANTIYALFYPQGINVTQGGGTTCQEFQGYHDDFALPSGAFVTYAVVPRCPPPPVQGVTEMDQVTAEASHEIIEAATDPLPTDNPAYSEVDANHLGWALLAGGEIGDLCAGFPDSFYKPAGVTNLVQRVWSNAAAAASHDPCEPQGNSPYFNAAPVETDTITIDGVQTKGVKIPIGQSKTVELDLYSDGPTSGPWKVSVLDVQSMFLGGSPALSLTLDKTQGQNGDKLQLTIHALAASSLGASIYWIQSDLGSASNVWLGVVGN